MAVAREDPKVEKTVNMSGNWKVVWMGEKTVVWKGEQTADELVAGRVS